MNDVIRDHVAGLVRRHLETRCGDALAELLRIVLEHRGNHADEAHAFVCAELGLVRAADDSLGACLVCV